MKIFKVASLILSAGLVATAGAFTSATAQSNCLKVTFRDDAPSCRELPSRTDIPQNLDPWKLSELVTLQPFAKIKSPAPYYENVVLAGDTLYVRGFLEFYKLNVIVEDPTFVRAMQPLWSQRFNGGGTTWAACNAVMGPGVARGSQMVCVAVDENGAPLDERIFSREYANEVSQKIFSFY